MSRKALASTMAAAVALFLVVGGALAQNADKNSAGPTKNDLKMRIAEPLEGATITGSSVQVSVQYDRARYRDQGNVDRGLDKFPPITFDIFVDNSLKQTLNAGDNVAVLNDIPPGSHKIVVMAKNISGEVVDRKEINVVIVAARAVAQSNVGTMPASSTAPVAPPASAYVPPPPPPVLPPPVETLPQTASNAPRLGLAGLVLLAGGLTLLKRRSK
jgi:LPXTG-motif cell wall-anchored protein